MKPIIIKGCSRSGTSYMASRLNKSGFEVGHERYMCCGVVGYNFTPMLFDLEQNIVGHQVRHPIRVIESFSAVRFQNHAVYFSNFIPVSPSFIARADLSALMQAWVLWNELAEQTSSFTYRVEDQVHFLEERLGQELDPTLSKTTNTARNNPNASVPTYQVKDLELASSEWFIKLAAMAERYGYEL